MQRGVIVRHRNSWSLLYYDTQFRGGRSQRVRVRVKLAPISKEFPTKRSVRLLADEKLQPVNRKRITPEASLPITTYIEEFYFPAIESRLRPSTVVGYKQFIYKPHLKSRLAKTKLKLKDFETHHAQRLLEAIPKVGHRTLLHIKHFLSAVFSFARQQGHLRTPNPVTRDVKVPGREKKFKGAAYSLDDFDGMLERIEDPTAQDVIGLLFFTGLRQSEARALRWSDWNEKDQTLAISRAVWRNHLGPTKNIESENVIPVLPMLAELLAARRNKIQPNSSDYIFAGERRGNPLNFHNLENRVIKPALSGSAVQWSGFHGFRRGLASNLFDLGINPKVVAGILRHSAVETTIQYYIKMRDRESRTALEQLEDKMRARWAAPSGVIVGGRMV